jgi:hypothetical protein
MVCSPSGGSSSGRQHFIKKVLVKKYLLEHYTARPRVAPQTWSIANWLGRCGLPPVRYALTRRRMQYCSICCNTKYSNCVVQISRFSSYLCISLLSTCSCHLYYIHILHVSLNTYALCIVLVVHCLLCDVGVQNRVQVMSEISDAYVVD